MTARLALLIVLCLLPVGVVLGFWSGVPVVGVVYTIHQDITKDALGSPQYSFGSSVPQSFSFSTDAINAINAMHFVADSPSKYDCRDHFDSESFLGASWCPPPYAAGAHALLSNRYKQLLKVLTPAADGSVDTATAWKLLGYMVHAIQDFYAHSTWVYKNSGIVDFGANISMGISPNFVLLPGQINGACDKDGVTLVSSTPITTGYYNSATVLFQPLPTDKCQHGTLTNGITRCTPGSTATSDGINHDSPCEFRDDPTNMIVYGQAKGLARHETIALVQAVVADLFARNNNVGFCELLDLDETLPVCQGTVGGTVSDLIGPGLVLQNNSGDNLTISANGPFTFPTALARGTPYSVTVLTQPTSPNQTCVVSSSTGTINGNVTNVSVGCSTNTYTVGGIVSGLTGSGLVLQNNSGDNLPVSGNGPFAFATAIAIGAAYNVTIFTQPTGQTCTVAGGSDTVNSNITNVLVSCSAAIPPNPDPDPDPIIITYAIACYLSCPVPISGTISINIGPLPNVFGSVTDASIQVGAETFGKTPGDSHNFFSNAIDLSGPGGLELTLLYPNCSIVFFSCGFTETGSLWVTTPGGVRVYDFRYKLIRQ